MAGFRDRELHAFPKQGTRITSLGIVVLATIVLYYQFYLAGAVATHILADLHMSFVYYVNISVVGYVLGAVGSYLTGLADRYGRANIVTIGLFLVGLLCLIGIPLDRAVRISRRLKHRGEVGVWIQGEFIFAAGAFRAGKQPQDSALRL